MPTLVLVAGPNGAGKSTLVRALGLATIDPDRIAREQHGSFSPEANVSASRQALAMVREALAQRRDLAQETTLASRQPLRLMAEAKSLGYRIILLFVTSDDDTRLRIDNRVLQGGHNIADVDLERRYPRVIAHLPEALREAELGVIYSSSEATADFRLAGLAHAGSLWLGEASTGDLVAALQPLATAGLTVLRSEAALVQAAHLLAAQFPLVQLRLSVTT